MDNTIGKGSKNYHKNNSCMNKKHNVLMAGLLSISILIARKYKSNPGAKSKGLAYAKLLLNKCSLLSPKII